MENHITFEIVNEKLFNEKVIDVDTSGLVKMEKKFTGNLSIETEDEGWVDVTGDFGSEDYVKEYGFKIVYNSKA